MHRPRLSERTKRVGAGSVIALTGLLFSLVFIRDLLVIAIGQLRWLVSGYSLVFSLLLLASSEWLRRQPYSGDDLLFIAGWMVGWAAPFSFVTWMMLLDRTSLGFWAVVTDIADVAVIGAVAGVLTGILFVRQRRTNEHLSRTQARLESVLDASPVPIIAVDADGTITTWNPAAERTLGWSADEAIGSVLPPSDTVVGFDDLRERFQTQRLVDGLEERRTTKTGDTIDVRTYFSPIYEDGDMVGGMAIVQDITEEKQREAELARSRNLLTWTEKMATVGGWEWDLESDTVTWTEGTRRIHGVDAEFTPTLESAIEFYHPEHRETLETLIERAVDHGEPYATELRLITADGRDRWVEVRGELVETGDGQSKLRGAIRDISEKKEHTQRLMVLNRVLRHNLRNDLNVIQGRAEMLHADLTDLQQPVNFHESVDTAELAAILSELATASDDLQTRISRFLDAVQLLGEFPVERAQGDARTIVRKSSDLASLGEKARRFDRFLTDSETGATEVVRVREVLERLATHYEDEFPAVSVEVICEEEFRIPANREQLEAALSELVENAIEHCEDDAPDVSLLAESCSKQRVEITVADRGPGLPKTELETLHQGKETPLIHGKGLGLWLVNWAVAQMDGSLRVTDNRPSGTRVTIALPANRRGMQFQ